MTPNRKLFTLTFLLFGIFSYAQQLQHKNDFDFYIGKWNVVNQRQINDSTWIEFTADVEVKKTLNGFGNVDFFDAVINGKEFSGMTVRLYDAKNDRWEIRWYDTDDVTNQPQPSIGNFQEDRGEFLKTFQTESGRTVYIRFLWFNIGENSFQWESSWSIDKVIWNPTWKMKFKRKR